VSETIKIRRMEEKDLEQVASIEAKNFSMPWSCEAFRDSLRLSHTLYLVAEAGDQIAGYCGCYWMLDEAEIVNVAVDSHWRGQGIGRKMLLELMHIGRELGVFTYMLEVRQSNVPAIRLYESLGFQYAGIRKNFYEKPMEDAKIYCQQFPLSESGIFR